MRKTLVFAGLAAMAASAPIAAQPHGPHHGPQGAHPPQHGQHRPPPPPGAHRDPAHASAEDQRAVLAVVDRMFAGLAAKNPAAILAEVVPEGRATANMLYGRRGVHSVAWPEFVAHLPRIPGRPTERLIDPHVHVEGDIAMIWSRYEFALDGRFAHCGVDHFDLIRQDGRWKVLNLTWTQQTESCPGRGPAQAPRGPVRQPPGERG